MVEECKLKVVYCPPAQPPSPVPEGSEEGSSPRGSISENGNFNDTELNTVSNRVLGFLFPFLSSAHLIYTSSPSVFRLQGDMLIGRSPRINLQR